MTDPGSGGEKRTNDIFARAPVRRLTDSEREFIHLKMEQIRIERERAHAILDKGLILYFGSLLITILGHVYGFIPSKFLNLLVMAGICILFLSAVPYLKITKRGEETLDQMMESLVGKL